MRTDARWLADVFRRRSSLKMTRMKQPTDGATCDFHDDNTVEVHTLRHAKSRPKSPRSHCTAAQAEHCIVPTAKAESVTVGDRVTCGTPTSSA
jgi:hypothetical protein